MSEQRKAWTQKPTVDEILNRYNLKLADVVSWGEAKYPSMKGNLEFLVLAYLRAVRGVNPREMFLSSSAVQKKYLNEVKEGEATDLIVNNVGEVESWTYNREGKERKGYKYIIADERETGFLVSFVGAVPEGKIRVRVRKKDNTFYLLRFLGQVEDADEKIKGKIFSLFKVSGGKVVVNDLEEFLKANGINYTVEEVVKMIGAKKEGNEIVFSPE